jgi:hypothetical protein
MNPLLTRKQEKVREQLGYIEYKIPNKGPVRLTVMIPKVENS